MTIKKAFDSITRNKIWECLHRLEINRNLIGSNNYMKGQQVVGKQTGRSEWFKSGVRQAILLTPTLKISLLHCNIFLLFF